MLQEDNGAATAERIRAELVVLEYSWEFCLIDFSVMAGYLPDFESVDDFDGCKYLFESVTDEEPLQLEE